MAQCVNIEHPNFKALAKEIGHAMAKSIVVANNYKIPTLNEAVAIIRGTKVKQFKYAINHIRSLKNPTIDELFKGFNGIVRKYGDDWYVVNGSRISDTPTPTAIAEIEQPNIKFLEALNDTFGNIFDIVGNVNKATGLKMITGNEPTVAGTSLNTAFSKSGDELSGSVADIRSLAKAVNSIYFGDAIQFASGKIVGPPSIPNDISLPYVDKAVAKKLTTLSDKFKTASKEEKTKIRSEMLKLADQAFAGLKSAMKKNISGLYDSWSPEYIARSRHWYDGANRIAQSFSKTYGLSIEATSAILAALSPQNEWFNNISGADRVMDIMKNFISVPVSTAMYDNAAIQAKGEPFEAVIRSLKSKYADKTLGDVLNLITSDPENAKVYQEIAGNVLRVIDLNVHGQEVYVVSPEGVQSGLKIDTGGLQRFAWGSTNEIFKAISIFQNPDIKNISEKLGKGNKVRNFYNNIVNPNSTKGEVTVDTHALASSLLNVVSAEDASSMGLFNPSISSLYSVAKEAYQEVAKEKGILPRELQSVTWEALRLLIKEADKKNADTREAINRVWDKVQSKKITNEQAIEDIIGRFSYERPQWDRPANPRTDRGGVQTSGTTVQQAERNGPDLRGQQPAAGETATGVVEDNVKSARLKDEIMTELEFLADEGKLPGVYGIMWKQDPYGVFNFLVEQATASPSEYDGVVRGMGKEIAGKLAYYAAVRKEKTLDKEGLLPKLLKRQEAATSKVKKSWPNAIQFAEEFFPQEYQDRYATLYEIASKLQLDININPRDVQYGASATFGHGQINLSPAIIMSQFETVEDFVEVFNHEVVHGLLFNSPVTTQYQLHKALEPIFKKVQDNFDRAPESVKDTIAYIADVANSNSHEDFSAMGDDYRDGDKLPTVKDYEELITYAFTSPEFAAFLDTIPSDNKKGKGGSSIFDELKRIIREFIKSVVGKTALDDINDALNEFFDMSFQLKNKEERRQQFSHLEGWQRPIMFRNADALTVNKTGATQGFFSDVVSGVEKFKPKKEWSPMLSFTIGQEKFKKIYDRFKGNFDAHIAASIPTFRETQIKVGAALKSMYQGGGLIYDIGGSEGGFVKAIGIGSGGDIRSINLDVNEQMQAAHEDTPVKGSEFVKEAFFEAYTDEDAGVTYPKHVPKEKADVVHESMVFQFISPERKQFIKEIKDNYIKPDGIVLLEEKIVPASQEEWANNEKKKDNYKLESFPQEAITEKAEQVLVGMKANQTSEQDLVDNLKANFKVVAQYWDAGNFKGYIASDSQEKVDEFLSSLGGPITSSFSSSQSKITEDSSLFSEPNDEVRAIADEYKKINNIDTLPGAKIYTVDVQFGKRIADAYMEMKDQPNNPEVKAAYDAFAQETMAQYNFLINKGYTFELYSGKGEPYATAPDAMADIRDNKHFFILDTNKYYGPVAITDQQRKTNPFLQDSGATDLKGKPLLYNDVFRGVHDLFGHAERGNGFGPVGEENAWDVHARMYTPLARRAMTTETRGHTSMIEFGPHVRNEAGEVTRVIDEQDTPLTDPVYPVAKVGLLPEEFSTLSEELDEERVGVRPSPQAAKVEVNEQALADMTEKTQQEEKPKTDGWKPVDSVEDFQKLNEREWSREQRKRFSIDQVVRMLKLKFGINVNYVNDPGSHWRGKYVNGTITLNEAYINPDTPFHEIFHPFIDVLKKDNPALYTQLMDEFKNSKEGKEYFEATKANYPELSEEEMWDEALVERLGYLSATKSLARDNTSMLDKFVDWLKTILAKMGINVQTFKSDMTLDQFADLLINPSFVFDLAKKIDNENHYERYSKLTNHFDDVINRVRQKLRADAASRPKGMTEDTSKRKYFSGKTAEALEADPKDLKAIDNFIISSAVNLKKLNERFEEFKQKFDSKKAKSPEDIAELGKLLNEIEDCVTLYEDVDLLISAVMDEFPDAEDSVGNLKKNYRREAALINDYKAYAKELIVNWLYPHGKAAINQAIATDKPFTVVSKTTYEAVQKELQGTGITPTKRQILEEAFKRELASYLTLAKKDASAVTQFLGPLLHSRDPLSALIARAVVEEYTAALKKGLTIQDRLKKIVRQKRGIQIFNTNQDHFNFYAKYLRQATSYEYQGLDKNGQDSYKEVQRWAFHEEFRWDEFYKSKRDMEKAIGPAPSKNDSAKWIAWKTKHDNWYNTNTEQKTVNGKQVRVPVAKYKSAEFAALQSDALFVEMYKAYKDANNKVGQAGLKYGIIPQSKIAITKPEKDKVKATAIEQLRLFIGDEDQVYFAQKNNLKEKRSVPVPFTRMVEDNELNFDLLNSVAKYAVSSEKYNSISQIEPHVNILKNFIGGNASLGLDARQVVKQSANGIKALSKAERKAMQVDAVRINNQLNAFLDDVVYGQPEKKSIVKMFNAKFKVEHKNGTTEIIKGFDNMAEHIDMPNLDYHGFEVGKERELKDYKVTMVRDTWNWSLNKTGNNLGLITAFSQLALNPVAGVVNIVRAKLETFVEGAAGRYFSLKDAAQAEAIYFKALGSGEFFEDFKGGKPSFLSSMAIDYDAIQGELQDELGKKINGSIASKLFRRNHLFFIQQGGEHYVQTHLMVAMALKQKIKLNTGEEISLYDAKKREYNGSLKMSDTNWTAEKDADFRQNVKFVNTNMHGNYNKLDKAYLQRSWWGSLLMMFRKHIYTGFASRYRGIFGQGGYVNYQTGNYTQGYYLTFMQGLVKQVRSLIEQKRMGTLTDEEKYAFRKIAADFTMMALLMFAFKSFDDDDDEEEFNDFAAIVSRRLISEGVQYTPVIGTLDLAKVVTNPAASVSTIDKVWAAVSQSISDPTAEYERSGAGYQAGQNKAAVKWGRAIPVYRQYVNAVEPERLLQFYGKNSIWFLKPSAGKDGTEPEE